MSTAAGGDPLVSAADGGFGDPPGPSSVEPRGEEPVRPPAQPTGWALSFLSPERLASIFDSIKRFFGIHSTDARSRTTKSTAFIARIQRSAGQFANSVVNFARPAPRPFRQTRRMSSAAVDKPRQWRVKVHVYQLVSNRTNRLCKSVGVGGVYHTGVEVGGVEFGFGWHDHESTGVWRQIPRQLPKDFARGKAVHVVLIDMGEATLTPRELQDILAQVMSEFTGNSYSVLHRNCNHFTIELCKRLVNRSPPDWINSAAAKGARVSLAVGRATSSIAKIGRVIRAPLQVANLRLSSRVSLLKNSGPTPRERWGALSRRSSISKLPPPRALASPILRKSSLSVTESETA